MKGALLFSFSVYGCFAHVMSLHHVYACLVLQRLEEDFRASDLLELELETTVSPLCGCWESTLVFWKSSQCS